MSSLLSKGVKRSRCQADHSPPSSAEVKECVELYLHVLNTSSWRGVWLSTGTPLHLTLLYEKREFQDSTTFKRNASRSNLKARLYSF